MEELKISAMQEEANNVTVFLTTELQSKMIVRLCHNHNVKNKTENIITGNITLKIIALSYMSTFTDSVMEIPCTKFKYF